MIKGENVEVNWKKLTTCFENFFWVKADHGRYQSSSIFMMFPWRNAFGRYFFLISLNLLIGKISLGTSLGLFPSVSFLFLRSAGRKLALSPSFKARFLIFAQKPFQGLPWWRSIRRVISLFLVNLWLVNGFFKVFLKKIVASNLNLTFLPTQMDFVVN